METPRVAVIGAGRWGKKILQTLALGNSTIAYVAYSGSPETKDFLRETYPTLPTTTDYKETLQDATVVAVIIATPIETHVRIVRDALLAGKHVLCEKPLFLSSEEVRELYALAHEKNCVLMTGYLYQYDPEFLALVEKVRTSERVDLNFLWEKYGTFDSPLIENLLVHELSLMLSIFETVSLENVSLHEPDVFDATFVGDRGTAHVHIDRTQQERVKRLTAQTDGESVTLEFTHDDLLKRELDAFFSEIERGTPDIEKQQRIDETIAGVLEELSKR